MIKEVIISDKFTSYLEERNLLDQYKRVKNNILAWRLKQADFKLRQPKKDKMYYFRINKQFRWLWKVNWDKFEILSISNHS